MTRPIPLLGDTPLDYVQRIEHSLDAGFAPTRIAGLAGELQQRSGRPSHRVHISGLLIGEGARDALGTLQTATQTGEELTFSADITAALDLQKVVIRSFQAHETAGSPQRIEYRMELVESPPLPPPAEVSGFGGLDGLGLGDLGLDAGVLGDIADLASDVAGAVDQALGAVEALGALASLAASGGLDFAGILQPLDQAGAGVGAIANDFQQATRSLGGMFSS
ncbi:hypothetical protein QTI66_01030 [Variovorax sp. J22R133]|uniref:hypothetical protein n=1 Tax=Variovorax brevis TaxID=3053503 RepID=UPI002578C014|nr:hypothetical protein [Variovorax sp. J22R133]MDM0110709.1 hypothetical protein [Variovorax sp. J22R133]